MPDSHSYEQYLGEHCLDEPDFFDVCVECRNALELYLPSTSVQPVRKPPDEVLRQTRQWQHMIYSYIKQRRVPPDKAMHLQRVALCFLFNAHDNQLLQSLIRWNEMPSFEQNDVHVCLVPRDQLQVYCIEKENGDFSIEMTTGFRQLLCVAIVYFFQAANGKNIQDDGYMRQSIEQILSGRTLIRFDAPMEEVASTGYLATFAKLFLWCHELAHGIANREAPTRSQGRLAAAGPQQEFEADKLGFAVYLASALMMIPPFDKLLGSGDVETVEDRRKLMLTDPALGQMIERAKRGERPTSFDLGNSSLLQSHEDLMQTVRLTFQIWSVPILVFHLIDCIESCTGASYTHPKATDRLKQFWRNQPSSDMEKMVERHTMPIIRKMFG